MSQGESRLSREIMSMLRAEGIWCFKVHGGPTMMAGLPDIIACVPIHIGSKQYGIEGTAGTFVGFETKMPTGHVSPIQERVHANIREASGAVFVVRSVQDAVEGLQSIGWRPTPTTTH